MKTSVRRKFIREPPRSLYSAVGDVVASLAVLLWWLGFMAVFPPKSAFTWIALSILVLIFAGMFISGVVEWVKLVHKPRQSLVDDRKRRLSPRVARRLLVAEVLSFSVTVGTGILFIKGDAGYLGVIAALSAIFVVVVGSLLRRS